MARGWNPSQHPRDSKGRWKKKGGGGGSTKGSSSKQAKGDGPGISFPGGPGTITLRASLRSATVQYGKTFPLIPGKANIYLGALVRVEKAGNKPTFVERKRDEAIEKVITKIPKGKVGDAASDLLRNGQTNVGGVKIGKTGGKRRSGGIRVSNAKGKVAGERVRRGRKPRAPRQPRAKRVQ